MNKSEFPALLQRAWEAGRKAGLECRPVPMRLGSAKDIFSREIDYSKPVYTVDDGACGFAWVNVPGNTAFGRWLKVTKQAHKGYPRGLDIWISEFGQSVERKEACARAMAAVLRESGVSAYAGSRLD